MPLSGWGLGLAMDPHSAWVMEVPVNRGSDNRGSTVAKISSEDCCSRDNQLTNARSEKKFLSTRFPLLGGV